VLKAVGALRTLRYMDRNNDGRKVPTCHAGNAVWRRPGSGMERFSLLGLGLAGDLETACGMINILTAGIRADGVPPCYYSAGRYYYNTNNRSLPGVSAHFTNLCPDLNLLKRVYPSLTRYVRHWLRDCDSDHNGLAGVPGWRHVWDDSLRWQSRFPVAFERGEDWRKKYWGEMHPELFENVDTNTHLYLECLALGWMAAQLGRRAEACEWTGAAAVLKRLIQRHLFNPAAGVYQTDASRMAASRDGNARQFHAVVCRNNATGSGTPALPKIPAKSGTILHDISVPEPGSESSRIPQWRFFVREPGFSGLTEPAGILDWPELAACLLLDGWRAVSVRLTAGGRPGGRRCAGRNQPERSDL